jgi:hypothetical protein
MNLIKNDIFKISNNFTTTVKHGAENFCGHYQTLSSLVDLEISCYETNISKSFFEVTILLIGKCLDWRCINRSETVYNAQLSCTANDGRKNMFSISVLNDQLTDQLYDNRTQSS